MRLLLTNDDGIEAAGLRALEQACGGLGERVTVAPTGCRSYVGHQVTVGRAMAVTRYSPSRFAVDGTPADCVRLALTHLAPKVDLVVSGINHGANLGVDLYTSGTAAAAREAAFFGLPAVAVSHYQEKGLEFDWDWAARQVARVLPDLLRRGCPEHHFWSINLPHSAQPPEEAELCFVPIDPSPHDIRYQFHEGRGFLYAGVFQARGQREGHDVAACFGGKITASLVSTCGSAPVHDLELESR